MSRVLLLFLDGVGLGENDAAINPFAAVRLPTLERLLDGKRPLADSLPYSGSVATLLPIDASLGVAGLPQSGTGHVALLTGLNAPAHFGRHFGPWVPTALRPILAEQSLLKRAVDAGHSVAFANAYPEEFLSGLQLPDGRRRAAAMRQAGPPLAAVGAGLLTRHTTQLLHGDAVASEITNEGWRERLGRVDLPSIVAQDAGRNLARIVAKHELTLFAHYSTDYEGHRGGMAGAVAALERVDGFLEGLISEIGDDTLVILCSDHGNIEDVRVGHTLNPALGLLFGEGHADTAARIAALTDIAPVVLDTLRA